MRIVEEVVDCVKSLSTTTLIILRWKEMIISDYVKYRLDNHLNGAVIATGMDGSGKTTMLKELMNDFNYIKYVFQPTYYLKIPYESYCQYQLFDRSPLIEFYVYTDLNRDRTKAEKELEFNYLKENIKYIDNPMFVIYLHQLWDTRSQPNYVDENKKRLLNRYIDIIEMLNKMKIHTVVCTGKKFKFYN